jgi:hypothetical protein
MITWPILLCQTRSHHFSILSRRNYHSQIFPFLWEVCKPVEWLVFRRMSTVWTSRTILPSSTITLIEYWKHGKSYYLTRNLSCVSQLLYVFNTERFASTVKHEMILAVSLFQMIWKFAIEIYWYCTTSTTDGSQKSFSLYQWTGRIWRKISHCRIRNNIRWRFTVSCLSFNSVLQFKNRS